MSLIAYLQIGNNDIGKYSNQYLVKDVNCKFMRNHNAYRPTEDAFCRRITVSVFITDNTDLSLYNWYISGESQDGRIIIEMTDPRNDNDPDITKILFSNTFCFELKESYEIDTKRRLLSLGLMAEVTTLDDVEFKM